ncbi:uncharacterized protein BXZ73DRAFT_53021 [Epithele typhae]|uniref:uncharacterized protein n=1 Tax=Epithele typhae TaxID=378194 RepID=UPI0020082DE8|nr:uncharacterized protein BXZ73DRAFT_92556 [Epithele typhae]XP_047873930.1 uncharacterized protein BXZ73DRAFT_53021 [Epithele typhae]KAH9915767.1 hypothetical protein BXZ73DRAFT_92556 [Epithele typhae]KAH9918413.1 hypothetical protein BXZ73DRAFT_53021 [Epithele typhae]
MPAAAKRGDEGSSKSKKQKQKGVPSIPPSDKKDKHRVRKLVPPRPFPTVPASVSATGPRSAHTEGKNYICITRRTELGAYLRRCKDVFLKDGHKTLHLSAMGAAIPHLMQLALSLPEILPYPRDEVHTEVLTGTVELQDELIPVDDDEDMSYRTRSKSTVSVVIKIGDGVDEPVAGAARGSGRKKNTGRGKSAPSGGGRQKGNKQAISTEPIIFREDEMDES